MFEEVRVFSARGCGATQRAMLNVGVLGSTRGTSLRYVFDAIERGELPHVRIAVMVTNRRQAQICDQAVAHKIPFVLVRALGRPRDVYDAELTRIFENANVDLVLCIGWMRILSAGFCQRWRSRVLNVHPSLLPNHAGGMDLEVHKAVLESGDAESGCTVHFVTEEVDGGEIVLQKRCAVANPHETPQSLKTKVQKLEGEALVEVLRGFSPT